MKQPISRLPFKIKQDRGLGIVDLNNNYVGNTHENKDMEYIIEACNSYPTAIKLLKNILEQLNKNEFPTNKELAEYNNVLNNIENELTN